jgi:cysteine desulfurase
MNRAERIYLDYSATTPVDPRVMEKMLPYFNQIYGNPSSVHSLGQQAEAALETGRETVAGVLNCDPSEIVFTSCGTESDNLALRGVVQGYQSRKRHDSPGHLLISPVEHHAVSNTAKLLSDIYGVELEYHPVDKYGMVHPADLTARLRADTILVSVIYANNEIGTINPISEIGAICRERGIPFHTDAVQAGSYLSLDVQELNVDLMALGAHKFYGPKGVGVLYVRKGTALVPAQSGGGQEFGLRAGTHNIPLIVGMAEALSLAQAERQKNSPRLADLRDHLIGNILESIPQSCLTGHPTQRLPNHASFAFRGVDGNMLLMMLDSEGFACSSGSACKTGDPEPSEVLTSLGLDRSWGLGSLRVTLGVGTDPEEIDLFLKALPNMVERVRSLV